MYNKYHQQSDQVSLMTWLRPPDSCCRSVHRDSPQGISLFLNDWPYIRSLVAHFWLCKLAISFKCNSQFHSYKTRLIAQGVFCSFLCHLFVISFLLSFISCCIFSKWCSFSYFLPFFLLFVFHLNLRGSPLACDLSWHISNFIFKGTHHVTFAKMAGIHWTSLSTSYNHT